MYFGALFSKSCSSGKSGVRQILPPESSGFFRKKDAQISPPPKKFQLDLKLNLHRTSLSADAVLAGNVTQGFLIWAFPDLFLDLRFPFLLLHC